MPSLQHAETTLSRVQKINEWKKNKNLKCFIHLKVQREKAGCWRKPHDSAVYKVTTSEINDEQDGQVPSMEMPCSSTGFHYTEARRTERLSCRQPALTFQDASPRGNASFQYLLTRPHPNVSLPATWWGAQREVNPKSVFACLLITFCMQWEHVRCCKEIRGGGRFLSQEEMTTLQALAFNKVEMNLSEICCRSIMADYPKGLTSQ